MPDVRVFSDPWGHHVSHLRGRLDEGLHGCIDVRPPAEPQVEAEQHQRGQGAVPRHGSDRRCHGEGGIVAMLAASRDKRIAALALVATPGVTGAELNLEQVKHALDRTNRSAAEKQATLVPCATWHPVDNPDPPGCNWFTTPPEP